MNNVHFGAQLYTLRAHTQTAADFDATLSRLAADGFHMVQISGAGPIAAADFDASMKRHGFTCCCTHVPFDRLKNDLDQVMEEHRIFGCDVIGLGAIPPEFPKDREGYLRFAQWMNRTGANLRENGFTFAYHNHHFEFERFGGETGMDLILGNTDPRYVQFIPDVYWLQYGGVSPVDWIVRQSGRIASCHLKDYCVVNDEIRYALLGDGNLDFPAITQALNAAGCATATIELDDCYGADPFEVLKKSLDYIVDVAARM